MRSSRRDLKIECVIRRTVIVLSQRVSNVWSQVWQSVSLNPPITILTHIKKLTVVGECEHVWLATCILARADRRRLWIQDAHLVGMSWGRSRDRKRPDIVLYVNGIALGVLELKRSIVSVAEGIRQNLDNQKKIFIEHFFPTIQLVMAGNDTEGLRYATIQTPEKYYLTWKEVSTVENPLDRALLQLCEKKRFLEIVHDFIVFDSGIKKLCRHNQYFGTKAAQDHVRRREGGIIWHTQGSGNVY